MTFYVYIHRKQTTGEPFYVGKGSGRRGGELSSGRRNLVWNRIKNKHGVMVEIAQDGMSEGDSHLLEMWLIAKFRNDGVFLANMTDGGEGVTGMIPTWRKRVFSKDKNGEVHLWEHAARAVEYLRDRGISASQSNISSAATGKRNSAYKMVWWYEGESEKDYISKESIISNKLSKPIRTSCGKTFKGCSSAARWLRDNGYPNATGGSISTACLRNKKCYGSFWSYIQ